MSPEPRFNNWPIPAQRIPRVQFNSFESVYKSHEDRVLVESAHEIGPIDVLKKTALCWTLEQESPLFVMDELTGNRRSLKGSQSISRKVFGVLPQQLREVIDFIELPQPDPNRSRTVLLLVSPHFQVSDLQQLQVVVDSFTSEEDSYAFTYNLYEQVKAILSWQNTNWSKQLLLSRHQEQLNQLRCTFWDVSRKRFERGGAALAQPEDYPDYIHEISHFTDIQIRWFGTVDRITSYGFRILLELEQLVNSSSENNDLSPSARFNTQERVYRLFMFNNLIKALGESRAMIHEIYGQLVLEPSKDSSYNQNRLLIRLLGFLSLFNDVKERDSIHLERLVNQNYSRGKSRSASDEHNLGVFLLLVADNPTLLTYCDSFSAYDSFGTDREALVSFLITRMLELTSNEDFSRNYLLIANNHLQLAYEKVIHLFVHEFRDLFGQHQMLREQLSPSRLSDLDLLEKHFKFIADSVAVEIL